MLNIKVKKLTFDAIIPSKANTSDAGFDLYSVVDLTIPKGKREIVSLGISAEIPDGFFISIRDRSGLAVKAGIHVLAGVIDSGYRGEWKVVLMNLGDGDYEVKKGDRIAQAIVHEVPEVKIEEVEELSESSRGAGGFGSSGR